MNEEGGNHVYVFKIDCIDTIIYSFKADLGEHVMLNKLFPILKLVLKHFKITCRFQARFQVGSVG
jgi:hypothetical protein